MVSTSGAQLLPQDAVKVLCKELLPITAILTPNLPEAKLLLQESNVGFKEPKSIQDMIEIAKAVQKLGPRYVLLKGGHLPLTSDGKISKTDEERHSVVNVLHGDNETVVLENKYQRSKNTHGTGCSLACRVTLHMRAATALTLETAAIACNLACGMTVAKAVKAADQYVEAGIRTSKDLGYGSGPINHFHSTYKLPFSPSVTERRVVRPQIADLSCSGRFVEYLLDREDVQGPWRLYTEHDFVRQMQLGTLSLETFKDYLIQDYLFLVIALWSRWIHELTLLKIQFSRANALAAYKGKTLEDIKQAATNVLHVQDEVKLHLEYCKEFGLDVGDVQNQEESTACTAYTRYVLDLGQSEDFLALQIALLPCLLGYGMIAKRLFDDPETLRDGNKYWKWIETYVAEDYKEAVDIGRGLIEKHAVNQSALRIEELVKIFIHATKVSSR